MRYLETTTVGIDEPQDYPGNPRIHDEDWLDGVTRKGQTRGIMTRRLADGTLQILGGHGARKGLRRNGHTTIRCDVFEADDIEAAEMLTGDNPRPGIGGFDYGHLLELLDLVHESTGSLEGAGWDQASRDDLVRLLEAPDLDDLADEVGDPLPDDVNVVVRVSVPREVRDRLERLMRLTGEDEEADAFAGVLAWASTAARGEGLDVEP